MTTFPLEIYGDLDFDDVLLAPKEKFKTCFELLLKSQDTSSKVSHRILIEKAKDVDAYLFLDKNEWMRGPMKEFRFEQMYFYGKSHNFRLQHIYLDTNQESTRKA